MIVIIVWLGFINLHAINNKQKVLVEGKNVHRTFYRSTQFICVVLKGKNFKNSYLAVQFVFIWIYDFFNLDYSKNFILYTFIMLFFHLTFQNNTWAHEHKIISRCLLVYSNIHVNTFKNYLFPYICKIWVPSNGEYVAKTTFLLLFLLPDICLKIHFSCLVRQLGWQVPIVVK